MTDDQDQSGLSFFQKNRKFVFLGVAIALMALGIYDLLVGGHVLVGIALIAFGLLWAVRASRA